MRIGEASTTAQVIPILPYVSETGSAVMQLSHVRSSRAKLCGIEEISMSFGPGELACITGGRGAGKSALLSILALREGRWSGQYLLCGVPVHELPWRERRQLAAAKLGAMLEGPWLIEELTVGENLEIPLAASQCPVTERRAAIHDTLASLGILALRDFPSEELFGPDLAMAALARAIVARPAAVILDDPFRGLGLRQRDLVCEALAAVRAAGSTILVASCDVPRALTPDRVIEIRHGRALAAINY